MEFNELKSNWQESKSKFKSSSELQMMTKAMNHPKLKRIRIKLIIEVLLLISFLVVYNNVLDGHNKPLWINILLGMSAVLFVLNDIIGYFNLQNLIGDSNIKRSLNDLIQKLKRLSILSMVCSLFFGLSIILFLTSTIDFTAKKYLILIGMIITLIALSYLSYRNWSFRINHFKKTTEELKETENQTE